MTAAMLATSYSFAQASVSVEPNADIRVLIDVSGSMKQNDPKNLRRPALDLLVQLFPSDSRAGVWTFGKYVNMLVPHDTVSTRWRDQSANKSRLINSVALHTNIGLALEKAIYDQEQKNYSNTQDFKTSVILLTDGVVDIDKDPVINERERQRILETLLPQYQAAGIAIHAVALSTNADVELLERLAIETDGIFAVAEDAEDLNRIFLRAFDQSSPSDRAPLDDNRFLIDSSVEEFTALVFRTSGSAATQIQSPSGQIFNADFDGASLRWFASDAYDLITIQQPEEGEWTINADIDPDNRVTVVSDLT
ncbi:MAG: VWA domain-containing protein, partial [Pseudomonadales bacterium]|nr:VWA domain-containing protein [Pseudomonadales bacterium]